MNCIDYTALNDRLLINDEQRDVKGSGYGLGT